MSEQNNIIKKVWQTINRHQLFNPGESIIVGVSGGPDSVVLLAVLDRINRLYRQDWKLYLAHLNHQIRRDEAERDEKFVRALGRQFGYPVLVKKVNVPVLAQRKKYSLEEAARQARYKFFAQLACPAKGGARSFQSKTNQSRHGGAEKISPDRIGTGKIAVGHHQDDHAETILFRIIRGCGLRGLRGIRPVRPLFYDSPIKLVRPLIEVSREEIMVFLKKEKIAYQIDRTNLDKKITRNRIRLELIPYLQKYNPQVKKSLVRLAEIARVACDYLDEKSRPDNIKKINDFGELHPALQAHLDEEKVRLANGPAKNITAGHYRVILNRLKKNKTVEVLPDYHVPPVRCGIKIKIPGESRFPQYQLEVKVAVLNPAEADLRKFIKTKTDEEEVFDFSRIKKPLVIRLWRAGDKFQPLGVKGKQSLKKFFIDHKIPRAERRRIPLVVSGGRIIWVVGYRIDERFKVTTQTKKILKITAVPL